MSLLLCLLVSRRNALFISICSSLFILDAMKYYTVNVNVRHTFPNATAAFSSFYCYPLSLSYCKHNAFTEFPINPTSLSLSLDPRHDMSSSG